MTEPKNERIRFVKEEVLSDNWSVLKKHTFDFLRRDGRWQRLEREVYDRGDAGVVLLFDPRRECVLLTRQFRLPALVNGHADGMLVEACAGLLDDDDPLTCVQREAEEETGYRVRTPHKVFEAYMSPGSVTEKLHFFVAEYEPGDQVSAGGGHPHEGEDIELLELPLAEALQAVADGRIEDAKTIMLVQYLALRGCRAPAQG